MLFNWDNGHYSCISHYLYIDIATFVGAKEFIDLVRINVNAIADIIG